MAKYTRNLYKDDSYFKSKDSENEQLYSFKDVISEAKEIRTKAFTAAKKMLEGTKPEFYDKAGVTGPAGVIGPAGVMGTSGVQPETVRISEINIPLNILDDYYNPVRGVSEGVHPIYNAEDGTYTIGDKKYTVEDLKLLNAFHSINPHEAIMSSCGANMTPVETHGASAPIYGPISQSIDVDSSNSFKTGSCAEPIKSKENSYWKNKWGEKISWKNKYNIENIGGSVTRVRESDNVRDSRIKIAENQKAKLSRIIQAMKDSAKKG